VTRVQVIFGVVLVLALLGMAAVFAWRQWRALRALSGETEMPPEDRKYIRNQAVRRLVCAALMVVLAVLLVWWFPREGPTGELVQQGEEARERGEKPVLSPEQERVVHASLLHVILILVVLFAVIVLAGMDFLAIRRFGIRHYRKIQADRRAMIERQLARLRSQRNGHG
jgi:MFS superfamily sulfate permease-like transporter